MGLINLFEKTSLNPLFESLNLQLMDVGARGGMDADLLPGAWSITATGFEPESDECERLNKTSSAPWKAARYVPAALGAYDGQAVLHLPASEEGASLLTHNPAMLPLFGYETLHREVRQIPVATLTLDSAIATYQLANPDYLKIDVEGAELAILKAAPKALSQCLALKVEVSFLEQRLEQPLMHDILSYLLDSGFVLADIRDLYIWRRRPLTPHPFSSKWQIPYSRGVPAQCDLVFLRDPSTCADDASLSRLIGTASVLGYFDHAVMALRNSTELEENLNRQVGGNFIDELGKVSRHMGRLVAFREAVSRLHSMAPLTRSIFGGLPCPRVIYPGY